MKFYRLFCVTCLFILWTLLQSCQPQTEPAIKPTAKNTSGAKVATTATSSVGPYTITFIGVEYSNGGSTWTYTVARTGSAQGNGLSHLIFGLGCVTRSQVVEGTIDGKRAKLEFSEGKGTGCEVNGNFVKFDGVPSDVSDGNEHTFTFTLNTTPGTATNGIWVKAGRNCYQSTIPGPGCENTSFQLKGRMEIRYCMGIMNPSGERGAYGIHVAGISVQLFRADNLQTPVATTTTDANGYYTFSNIPGGIYKVLVDTQSYNNTAVGCNGQSAMDIVYVHDMTDPILIPSQYYEDHKNHVDFWLDTYMPGTCGPDIVEGSDWTRGPDSYNCP